MLKQPTWLNPGEEWKDFAACRAEGPELFFYSAVGPGYGNTAEYQAHTSAAAALCRECPVQQECLDYALVNNEEYGIWGGSSVSMRKKMRRDHLRELRRAARDAELEAAVG